MQIKVIKVDLIAKVQMRKMCIFVMLPKKDHVINIFSFKAIAKLSKLLNNDVISDMQSQKCCLLDKQIKMPLTALEWILYYKDYIGKFYLEIAREIDVLPK